MASTTAGTSAGSVSSVRTAAVREWSAEVGVLDTEILDVLQLWRTHVPVVVLTNATDRLDADLAALGLHNHVDEVVNSSTVGHAKPSTGAYDAAHTALWSPGIGGG